MHVHQDEPVRRFSLLSPQCDHISAPELVQVDAEFVSQDPRSTMIW